LCFGILLVGCTNNNPVDTATTYVQFLSELKLDAAKSTSKKEANSYLEKLPSICQVYETNKLTENSLDVLAELKRNEDSAELIDLFEKVGDIVLQYKTDMNKEYGSYEDRSASNNKKIDEGLHALNEKMVADMMKILSIHKDNSVDIQKVIASFLSGRKQIKEIAKKYLSKRSSEVTSSCLAKETVYGPINKINHLETLSKSPDFSIVRLELIYKNNTSTKVSMKIENINKKWQVVGFNKE